MFSVGFHCEIQLSLSSFSWFSRLNFAVQEKEFIQKKMYKFSFFSHLEASARKNWSKFKLESNLCTLTHCEFSGSLTFLLSMTHCWKKQQLKCNSYKEREQFFGSIGFKWKKKIWKEKSCLLQMNFSCISENEQRKRKRKKKQKQNRKVKRFCLSKMYYNCWQTRQQRINVVRI